MSCYRNSFAKCSKIKIRLPRGILKQLSSVRLTFMTVNSTCMLAFHSNDYLRTLSNVVHQNGIHLIINSATDNTANTSTLRIKSHNISSLCVRHHPEYEYETSGPKCNKIVSETSLGRGRAAKGFGQDRIRTLVSMATDSPIRL